MIGLTFVWIGEVTMLVGGQQRLFAWIAAAYMSVAWVTGLLMAYTTKRYQKQLSSADQPH
jgi:uncharacterized membrane protein YphA (DoxX/SURF4 family)